MINYHTIILEQRVDRPGPRRYAIGPSPHGPGTIFYAICQISLFSFSKIVKKCNNNFLCYLHKNNETMNLKIYFLDH